MSKFCSKCGLRIADDDFLCPNCGAIWGDRIYKVRQAAATDFSLDDEPDAGEAAEPASEAAGAPDRPERRKWPRYILPLIAVLLGLALVFALFESDWLPWAGEGNSVPYTTTTVPAPEPTTTLPLETSAPTMPSITPGYYMEYIVQIITPFGRPIPGVEIADPLNSPFISSYQPGKYVTDENGTVTFSMPIGMGIYGELEPYVYILSVPDGYSDELVGKKIYFDEGQTLKTIIIDFEAFIEIDPPAGYDTPD